MYVAIGLGSALGLLVLCLVSYQMRQVARRFHKLVARDKRDFERRVDHVRSVCRDSGTPPPAPPVGAAEFTL
jgi:hypothetical protein